jgi:hypothetical protein
MERLEKLVLVLLLILGVILLGEVVASRVRLATIGGISVKEVASNLDFYAGKRITVSGKFMAAFVIYPILCEGNQFIRLRFRPEVDIRPYRDKRLIVTGILSVENRIGVLSVEKVEAII